MPQDLSSLLLLPSHISGKGNSLHLPGCSTPSTHCHRALGTVCRGGATGMSLLGPLPAFLAPSSVLQLLWPPMVKPLSFNTGTQVVF
uniref:Uncharacterized protein n=1 Tax=Cyanoderma ruficeps TaxID=181631 RepID=A0A8C3QSW5_9PASS